MQPTPPVSIIIPTLNEEWYLPLLLASLQNITTPLDVIVVDGNSEDGTVQMVKKWQSVFSGHSSLRLFSSERGIALQRNKGAEVAIHPILIFCDADVIMPTRDVHSQLIAEFIANNYAAAAPVLIPIESRFDVWLVHKIANVMQRVLLLFGRPYFGGAYLITTKDVFTKVGGFDTKVLIAEDIDYSLKAVKFGPCGLLNPRVSVSARRIIKYGYGWILKEIPNMIRLIFTGHFSKPERIFYPFGKYDKPTSK